MRGPLILGFVGLVALTLLWLALFGGRGQDLERGLQETDDVFALIETELRELDPVYKEVTRRGLMLALKRQHDTIRSQLATLRARQRHVAGDTAIDPRERLPALRALRDEADGLLGLAIALHRQVKARYDFMLAISPDLDEARRLDARLHEVVPDDPALRSLVASLTGTFSDIESQAKRTDTLLQQNLQQGEVLGQATRKRLAALLVEQKDLLERLAAAGG